MATQFGKRVKELREKKEWTLEKLADAISSTKSYIWDIENKPTIRPSAEIASKLADALDTTVDVLLGRADVADLHQEEQVFFRKYRKLKPPTQKVLQSILETLKDQEK